MKPLDEFAATVVDALVLLGPVAVGRFFGGYGLKYDGVQFAMIFRGALYLRVDAALATELIPRGSAPFEYERNGRLASIGSYHSVPADGLENPDLLVDWARRSIAVAARVKRPAKRRTKGRSPSCD